MNLPREIPPGRYPGQQFWVTCAPHRLRPLVVLLRFIWDLEHVR